LVDDGYDDAGSVRRLCEYGRSHQCKLDSQVGKLASNAKRKNYYQPPLRFRGRIVERTDKRECKELR
jgi:hypothetical protein